MNAHSRASTPQRNEPMSRTERAARAVAVNAAARAWAANEIAREAYAKVQALETIRNRRKAAARQKYSNSHRQWEQTQYPQGRFFEIGGTHKFHKWTNNDWPNKRRAKKEYNAEIRAAGENFRKAKAQLTATKTTKRKRGVNTR